MDTAITRRRTDWWGVIFLAAIVFCLVACFAFLLTLLGALNIDPTGWPIWPFNRLGG